MQTGRRAQQRKEKNMDIVFRNQQHEKRYTELLQWMQTADEFCTDYMIYFFEAIKLRFSVYAQPAVTNIFVSIS